MSDFKHLEDVEDTMYRRMLRNSYNGAIKGALVGAVIAIAVGAALGAALFFGFPTLVPALAAHGLWGAMTAGAVAVAAVSVPIAARLGGTAGVQSTRDARRFMQADRLPQITLSEAKERQRIFELSNSVAPSEPGSSGQSDFQEKIEKQRQQDSTLGK